MNLLDDFSVWLIAFDQEIADREGGNRMQAKTSQGPRASVANSGIAGNWSAASRLSSNFLSPALDFARIWSEELDRALAATKYYEQLTIGRETNFPFRDRAGKARQVFIEFYSRAYPPDITPDACSGEVGTDSPTRTCGDDKNQPSINEHLEIA